MIYTSSSDVATINHVLSIAVSGVAKFLADKELILKPQKTQVLGISAGRRNRLELEFTCRGTPLAQTSTASQTPWYLSGRAVELGRSSGCCSEEGVLQTPSIAPHQTRHHPCAVPPLLHYSTPRTPTSPASQQASNRSSSDWISAAPAVSQPSPHVPTLGSCMPNSAFVRLSSGRIASCGFSYTVFFTAMSVCCSNHAWNTIRCPVPPEVRMPAICPFPTTAVLWDLTDQFLLLLSCGIFCASP